MLCSLADLHRTFDTCTLCGLLMGALLRRWGPERELTADNYVEWANDAPGINSNPHIYLYSYLFAEDQALDSTTLLPNINQNDILTKRGFRLGIALRGQSDQNRPYLDHAGDIQLLSTSSSLPSTRLTFHGRIVDPVRANTQLAREWLDECEHGHGDLCEKAARVDDVAYTSKAPCNLRMIDVNSMSLVLLSQEVKYIVLSYCWAQSTRFFTTNKTNVEDLQMRNSLWGVWDLLPATIQDAIDFVRGNWPRVPMGRCLMHSPRRREEQRGANFADGSGVRQRTIDNHISSISRRRLVPIQGLAWISSDPSAISKDSSHTRPRALYHNTRCRASNGN